MSEERYQVTIVDRERQERFPRSKKRRIRNKWRKNRKNWGPLMVPVGHSIILGQAAAARFGCDAEKISESMSRRLEMHSKLWAHVQEKAPEFAALCDIVEAPAPYRFT